MQTHNKHPDTQTYAQTEAQTGTKRTVNKRNTSTGKTVRRQNFVSVKLSDYTYSES